MENQKAPTWYWVVAVIALIWNLMGVLNYLAQAFITEDMLAQMPQDQMELIINRPAWATAAFAIAVFGGLFGSLFLLFRKAIAGTLFVISFLGIIVQQIQSFFMTNSFEVYGPGGLGMAILILVIGGVLIYIAKKAKSNGWVS